MAILDKLHTWNAIVEDDDVGYDVATEIVEGLQGLVDGLERVAA